MRFNVFLSSISCFQTSPATQGSNTATVLRTVANTSGASRETSNPRFERTSPGYGRCRSTYTLGVTEATTVWHQHTKSQPIY